MSTQQNKQLLSGIFEAMAEGNTKPFVEAMAEDFRWRFAGEWSWARDWGETREAVRADLLGPLMAQFSSYRSWPEEILADEDRVVVLARAEARTCRDEDYRQAYCYVFGVREGLLTEVIEYCDTALVERVLELPADASG
jgi:uncharacterized protein